MNQLSLFDPPHNGTVTSKAAAQSMRDELPQLQRLALRMLGDHPGGLTREELAARSGDYGRMFTLQTACSIAHSLAKAGLVRGVGTRETMSGRQADVLTLSARGFTESRGR